MNHDRWMTKQRLMTPRAAVTAEIALLVFSISSLVLIRISPSLSASSWGKLLWDYLLNYPY
jgi:hypothetical protein